MNNAASGYVKALQHLVYGEGACRSSDLAETNYANVANAVGCLDIRMKTPDSLADALKMALSETGRPTGPDVVVTRVPDKMLHVAGSCAVKFKKRDRVA